jgi:hypothetical protein
MPSWQALALNGPGRRRGRALGGARPSASCLAGFRHAAARSARLHRWHLGFIPLSRRALRLGHLQLEVRLSGRRRHAFLEDLALPVAAQKMPLGSRLFPLIGNVMRAAPLHHPGTWHPVIGVSTPIPISRTPDEAVARSRCDFHPRRRRGHIADDLRCG